MSKIYVIIAEGFEEIEALTVVDMLRRAKLDVDMVSITDEFLIKGGHGIEVKCDVLYDDADFESVDMIVLPGGLGGTNNMAAYKPLIEQLKSFKNDDKYLAAICAAPSILGDNGLLEGKNATSYPGFEDRLKGATVSKDAVVCDGKVITSRGMGTAIDFSLAIIEKFTDKKTADEIAKSIIYR